MEPNKEQFVPRRPHNRFGNTNRTPKVNRRETPRDMRERRTIGLGARPDDGKIKAASAGLGAIAKGEMPSTHLGLGALDTTKPMAGQVARRGLGDLIDAVRNSVACPIWNMPVIESSRGTFGGPLLDGDITRLFGAKINPFGWSESTSGLDSFDTTLAQNGELQTPTLVCAVGWKLQPEPLCFTAEGNAWTAPESPQGQPFSPDVFTQNDLTNLAILNATQRDAGQVFEPAVLEWGWPMNYACWHMVRGYHLRWMIGQHTNIFDESLRNTAVMPTNAQEGSASSSEVDVNEFIARANQRYVGVGGLGSTMVFLKFDAIRLGSRTIGGANVGMFSPSRSGELVGATYGGMDLRSLLKDNNEFRKLAIPYFLNAGIPIGLYAQVSDEFQANIMREYLSATQTAGTGGVTVPPAILDAANISVGDTTTGTNVFQELTLDATPTNIAQQVLSQRRLFKGGDLKVEVDIKGFEVDEDWYNVLKNNAELRDAFMCECGCAWPK
jgi:hypothetical protein